MPGSEARGRGAIESIPGARATEQRLLELLRAHRDEARADPALLARPVRVVVPSRSLRLHVCERIAAELGATAGVAVQTLHALALELVERTGGRAGGGDALVEILVRRAARAEPLLAAGLEPFRDGYRPVVASVRDLLDSGLTPELGRPAAECLAATRGPQEERERAAAILRVALAVAGELVARGSAGRSYLLARAAEALSAGGPRALPARAVLVHGFADVTGRAADLLEALVKHAGGLVLLDRPPDPASPAESDSGGAFSTRLVERLQGVAGAPRAAGARPAAPVIEVFRAPGAAAEVREVARRLHALLGAGARPERCAVVARDLGPYRAALRAHLGALGVPFSALRVRAPLDGGGARIRALLELLEQGRETRTDRWLDALARFPLATAGAEGAEPIWRRPREELRLGLRLCGARRLEQVPGIALDPERKGLALPLRRGLERAAPASGGREGLVAPRCRLPFDELRAAQQNAERLLARLGRWSARAPLGEHLRRFSKVRSQDLGWRGGDRGEQRLRAVLEPLAADLEHEELERAEFALVVSRAAQAAVEPPLAGNGGGVQVLEVMEARGRTFEHLFLLGMERGAFPRPVRDDPLFGDDLRAALAVLLPEIPIKARGRDEERYLFAELVSSSPCVTLSWQVADDDGRARVVSPLCARLFGAGGEERVAQVPGVHDPGAPGPRTAREAALAGGIERQRNGHRERLAAALAERGHAPELASELAGVRTRVLEAFDQGPFEPEALAPWLGFLGEQFEASARSDPRKEPIYVTLFEALAACPWQTVLRKLLHLEPPSERFEVLPSAEPRAIGNVVHAVLEELARARGVPQGGSLEEALARRGCSVAWPAQGELEGLLYGAARAVLEVDRQRDPHAGHVRLLAECARGYLEHARDFLAWESTQRFPDLAVLGVEVEGRALLELDGGDLALHFKADRVERREGRAVLSDYKTGKVLDKKEFELQFAAGLRLQPALYALAAGGDPPARGRYLFLKAEGEAIDVGPGLGPGAYRETLERVVRIARDVWLAGTFYPRMIKPDDKEPEGCKYCDVAMACLRGDSGASRAVAVLAAGKTPALAVLGRHFALAAKPGAPKERAEA